MKLIPKTREDLNSIIDTTLRGKALVLDTLFTYGIAKFILDLISRERVKKVLTELKNTTEEIKEDIQKKVSKEYLCSDDFLIFINNALREVIEIRNAEKIKYFRSAIIGGMIRFDIEEGKKLLFIDALSSLISDSIILLININKMCSNQGNARITLQEIKQRYDYQQPDYLMANLRSLGRYNLVEVITPEIKEQNYSNYTIIYGSFGRDFISFISDYQ